MRPLAKGTRYKPQQQQTWRPHNSGDWQLIARGPRAAARAEGTRLLRLPAFPIAALCTCLGASTLQPCLGVVGLSGGLPTCSRDTHCLHVGRHNQHPGTLLKSEIGVEAQMLLLACDSAHATECSGHPRHALPDEPSFEDRDQALARLRAYGPGMRHCA